MCVLETELSLWTKGKVGTENVSQIAAESRNGTCKKTGRKMWEAETWENKILEKTALRVGEIEEEGLA